MTTRDAAVSALSSLIASAYAWKSGPSRRLKLWGDVPAASRPACFIFEGGPETYTWPQSAIPKRAITAKVFAYLDAKDSGLIGASLLNGVMDALDSALTPAGVDAALGRVTLGGAAHHCHIDGAPLKDPGDLDGDAVLIVPIKIILP